jgi:hypothetical protein
MERMSNRLPAAKVEPDPKKVADESLVSDVRAGLTPAQMVERKLASLLNSTPLPLSRLPNTPVQRPRP